jgi:MFS family permease
MGAGFRYVRNDPMVGPLMLLTALTTTFVFPFIAVLMVFYVRHVLSLEAEGMGTIMSASGLGALAGAIVLLTGDDRTLRRWLLFGILGCGVGIFGLSLTDHFGTALVLVTLISFCVSSLMGRISQTIQHIVPNELRGRVMGVFAMAFTGLMPYAALLLASLSDMLGFGRMLQICAILYTALAMAVLYRVPRTQVAEPEPAPAA